MNSPAYIRSAAQISIIPPGIDPLDAAPTPSDTPYLRAADPDFSTWLRPLEGRRMGRLMKRAVATAEDVLSAAGIKTPDAIVTGTGLGCVESTERFLEALCRDGEEMLSPTHFMLSTHNTIGSLIAIRTGCHGHNVTLSDRSVSADGALQHARMLLSADRADTVLVGAHDEVTPTYYELLRRIGFVGQAGQCPCAEASTSLLLTRNENGAMCRLADTRRMHGCNRTHFIAMLDAMLDAAGMQRDDVTVLVTGDSGSEADRARYAVAEGIPSFRPLTVRYKRVTGECYAASGLGLYIAARIAETGRSPRYMVDGDGDMLRRGAVALLTCSDGGETALSLLIND